MAPAQRLCGPPVAAGQANQNNSDISARGNTTAARLCRPAWRRRRRPPKSWSAGAQPDFTRGAGSHAAMGKVIRTQRKGRGSVFRVSSARWRLGRARGLARSQQRAQSP